MNKIVLEGTGKVGFKLLGQSFPKWLRRMFEGGKSSPFHLEVDLPQADATQTLRIPGPFDADLTVSQDGAMVQVSIAVRLDSGPVVWSFSKAIALDADPIPFRFTVAGAKVEGTLRFEAQ